MSQTTTSILIATLVTILMASPISDDQNQRNSLFSIVGYGHSNVNSLRMNPIRLRDNAGLSCPKEGFFADPRNCSRFYRCVDVADTGYFSIFNFECPTTQVFYEHTNTCVPGICPSQGVQPPINPPQPPPAPIPPPPAPIPPAPFPPPNNPPPPKDVPDYGDWYPEPIHPNEFMDPPHVSEVQPPTTLPPSPPPPSETYSPSPPPSPSLPEEPSESQKPQWLSELPPWFKETPWWFKTPPAWFHQPPAWFNAPPQSEIEIDLDTTGNDSEPIIQTGDIIKGDQPRNVSVNGIMDNVSLLNDNKTIRIHIPIHIVQQ